MYKFATEDSYSDDNKLYFWYIGASGVTMLFKTFQQSPSLVYSINQ